MDLHSQYRQQTLKDLVCAAGEAQVDHVVQHGLETLAVWVANRARPLAVVSIAEGYFQLAVLGALVTGPYQQPNHGLVLTVPELLAMIREGEWYDERDIFQERDLLRTWLMVIFQSVNSGRPWSGPESQTVSSHVCARAARGAKTLLVVPPYPTQEAVEEAVASWYNESLLGFIKSMGVIIRIGDESHGGIGVGTAGGGGSQSRGVESWEQ